MIQLSGPPKILVNSLLYKKNGSDKSCMVLRGVRSVLISFLYFAFLSRYEGHLDFFNRNKVKFDAGIGKSVER